MKNYDKLVTMLLAVVLTAGSASAMAVELENSNYTAKELENIYETNASVEKPNFSTFAVNSKVLPMTVIKQQNSYYCGPATACMVAKTLGLGNYTQSSMAQILAGRTERYQKTDTSLSSLENSIPYCIERNVPLIVNVKEMPDYSVSVGHFIAVNGYTGGSSGTSSVSKVTICDPHPDYCGSYTYDTSVIVTACKSTKVGGQNKGNFCRLA